MNKESTWYRCFNRTGHFLVIRKGSIQHVDDAINNITYEEIEKNWEYVTESYSEVVFKIKKDPTSWKEDQSDIAIEALNKIASCQSVVSGDVVSVARQALIEIEKKQK